MTINRLIDQACGVPADFKPAPKSVPEGKLRLICPVCQKTALVKSEGIEFGLDELDWPCPDHKDQFPDHDT